MMPANEGLLPRLYERRSELERKLDRTTCECDALSIVHALRLNKLAIQYALNRRSTP